MLCFVKDLSKMPLRSTELAEASYVACTQQLSATAASVRATDGVASLPLLIDVLPAALQYLVSSGSGIEKHVAYLSLERLCLESLGQARLLPHERYADLREFEMYQQALLGENATTLMHGQGFAADQAMSGAMDGAEAAAARAIATPAAYLPYRNSGQHHPDTIRRYLPATDTLSGPKLHCLANFYDAVARRAGSVTFAKASGLLITLCDIGMDGMMLGAGATVDEQDLSIVGLERRVRVVEAARVLDMDDAERAEWFRNNPPLQTAVRALRSPTPRRALTAPPDSGARSPLPQTTACALCSFPRPSTLSDLLQP